jgi:hypothetical protein
MSASQDSVKSSLSNLSLALEKLNAPAPSRPNTSLGFNTDQKNDLFGSDADGEDEEARTFVDGGPKEKAMGKEVAKRLSNKSTSIASTKANIIAPPRVHAATNGQPSTSSSSSVSKSGVSTKHSVMPPPPVPKNRLSGGDASTDYTAPEGSKSRINLHSGIIPGQPKGKYSFGNATAKQSIFGIGKLPGFGGQTRDRVKFRASKQTTLPVVEGSPVKGGGDDVMIEDTEKESESMQSLPKRLNENEDSNPFVADPGSSSNTSTNKSAAADSGEISQVSQDPWRNESRRASMAHRLLSQSLATNPMTPPRNAPASEGKGKGRAVSSTFPRIGVQDPKTAPGGLGKASGIGAHVSRSTRTTRASVAATAADSATTSPADTPVTGTPDVAEGVPKSVRVLKDCVIFVDVKTEDGIDAGGLFMDMLKGMGAKVRFFAQFLKVIYSNVACMGPGAG